MLGAVLQMNTCENACGGQPPDADGCTQRLDGERRGGARRSDGGGARAGLPRLPLSHVAPGAHSPAAVVGRQIHRALRRGLYPAKAGLQPRAHHHPQVGAARRARPTRQAAGASAGQTRDCAGAARVQQRQQVTAIAY